MTKIERLELLARAYLMGRGYDILKINDLKAADAPDWKVAVDFVASHSAFAALSSQPSRIDAAAPASETVEATSPAKLDYAARVIATAAQHRARAPGEPAQFTQNGILCVCQCSDCSRMPRRPSEAAAEPTLTPLQEEQILMGFHNPPDEPAPSASVREAIEEAANIANRFGDCPGSFVADRIMEFAADTDATPSPLMAAGEAAETDIMETLDRKIEHAKCMQKRAFDQGLDVQGERMHARQEAFLEVKAILMKGSVATSPSKRDYAARVMGEPTHDQINAAAEVIWNDRDARHGGSWSSVDPNLIAAHQTIATARAALIAAANVTAAAEPAREEIAAAEVQIWVSQQMMATEDADIDFLLNELRPSGGGRNVIRSFRKQIIQTSASYAADAILALKPRGGTTREETIEECAKVCEAHWSNYKRNYSSACADNALSETGMERVLTVIGAQADTADLLASHLRALSKPRGEPAREGGK